MTRIEESFTVNAPVKKIWDFLADFDTVIQYDPGVIDVKWQRPVGVGSVILVTVQRLGRRTASITIADWEPNHRMGMVTRSDGAKVCTLITMETFEGSKTKVTRSTEIEVGGLLKLIWPYLAYRARKEFNKLIRTVEAQNSSEYRGFN